jgi:uncharacterized protein
MRALLDVNVVIALFDPDHVFHDRAHDWWATQAKAGWSSCPIVENGVVRIMSHPSYSQKMRFTPGDLIFRLRTFAAHTNHEFWPDGISLRDERTFISGHIHGSKHLTDIYLLALARKNGGKLATFDKGIPISAVSAAELQHVCVI